VPSTDGFPLATTSPADLALARAIRAWGTPGDQTDGRGEPPLASRFSPNYRARLAEAWSAMTRITPEAAWQILLRDHQASCRFDPSRVHPSWFVRILEAESPSVRKLVAAQAPEPIRTAIRARFADAASSDQTNRMTVLANPEVAAWALTLWSERLVGDVVESADDPRVILALSRFSIRDLVRLVRAVGQAKHAFAIEGPGPTDGDGALARTVAGDRARIAYFRRMIGEADPRLILLARADLAASPSDRKRKHAALGLVTVARLLKATDARRARWAVQQIPYPIAKMLGSMGGGDPVASTGLPLRAVRAWESWIFEAAWVRMLSEGRLGAGGKGGQP